MRIPVPLQFGAIALAALAVLTASCTATESVTISDAAIASATTTALSTAGAGNAGGEDTGGSAAATPTAETAGNDDDPVATSAPEPRTGGGDATDECRYVEVDDFGDIQIEIDFIATDISTQQDTLVNYVLFDQAGVEIAQSSRFVEDLRPGEHIRLAIDTVEDAPADPSTHNGITCEIGELVPFDFGPEPFRPQAGDTCRFLELDNFGDIQIEIDVANPLDVREDLAIDYALRGADDVRFGDGVTFTDALDPGERYVETTDTLTDLPRWLTASDIACEILAIEDF